MHNLTCLKDKSSHENVSQHLTDINGFVKEPLYNLSERQVQSQKYQPTFNDYKWICEKTLYNITCLKDKSSRENISQHLMVISGFAKKT